MDLQTYRQQINELDQKLLSTLAERFQVAKEIAKLKQDKDHVYDATREQELMQQWLDNSQLDENFTRALFHLVLNESRNLIIRNAPEA